MAGRAEDPNKLVNVTCRVPAHVRDKFAGIALIMGDIKVSRRLERLILMDVGAVQRVTSWPPVSSKISSPSEEDTSQTCLEDDKPITLNSVQNPV